MANELGLKRIFRDSHARVVSTAVPNKVLDALFENTVITDEENVQLQEIKVATEQCRKLMSMLHQSPHLQPFIHLRLALIDFSENSWIVEEIDQKLPPPASRWQQLDPSADGKRWHFSLRVINGDQYHIIIIV